ncbi:hypothetical protein SOVF_132030 [Spinacia oleracea]|uniref:DUF4283 domain-containing protein n=1 Tax=Spinacia oleracea TaxID=3562 RepID=A0A9R0J7I9_SPIOL|nr:uncharacterized protein LOC110801613 [Spinacia oleracea]KNA11767.1 hypothetical protein SOVF_132030 [Spinacia oleracea]
MGNYASCALSTIGKHKSAKVIMPSGEVKQFQQPMKAAELMLEIPGYFLVNSKALKIGRKFSALNADEDLEIGNVYVMFGMKRVNSLITAADMGALFLVAKRGSIGGNKVRVVPSWSVESDSPPPHAEEEEEALDDMKVMVEELLSEFQHRRSICRSKKPVLETIVEEPVSIFSR